jgi:integrase
MTEPRKRGQRGPTKRAKGEGGLFQRSDGIWVARVDLGWDDEGKKIRAQVTSKDQAKAVAKLRKLRRDIEEHGFAPKGQISVKDWLTYWLSDVIRVRPTTHKLYTGIVNNHIVPSIGRHRLDRLEPQHVRAMLKTMETKGMTSSRRQAFIILNKALASAKSDGRITRVVTDGMDAPTPKKAERDSLTAAQARTVLEHAAKVKSGVMADRLGDLWVTYLLAGLRRGEGIGLQVARVDLEADKLDISAQLQRVAWRHGCGELDGEDWPCGRSRGASCPEKVIDAHVDFEYEQLHGGLYLVEPKSDKGKRIVPIVPWLHAALERRLDELEKERALFVADYGLVWPKPDGQPYDPNHITRTWDGVLKAAKVPDMDLHSSRHTTSTLLLEAGVDVHVVEAILGHADAKTTRGYQHVSTELSRAAMMKMERLLELGG